VYSINKIEDDEELLYNFIDLEIALTDKNGLASDVCAVKIHQEILVLKRI